MKPLSASELERELRTLRGRIDRLGPQLSHYPHRFHEEKSELRAFVDQLLDRLAGREPASAPAFAFTAPQRDQGYSHIRAAGRAIPVERKGRVRANVVAYFPFR